VLSLIDCERPVPERCVRVTAVTDTHAGDVTKLDRLWIQH
jgi:hypothetical protein